MRWRRKIWDRWERCGKEIRCSKILSWFFGKVCFCIVCVRAGQHLLLLIISICIAAFHQFRIWSHIMHYRVLSQLLTHHTGSLCGLYTVSQRLLVAGHRRRTHSFNALMPLCFCLGKRGHRGSKVFFWFKLLVNFRLSLWISVGILYLPRC